MGGNGYQCIVCEWSEGRGPRRQKYHRSELYEHFRSARHLSNWHRWLIYYQSQDIGGDYVEDWLQQHQLLSLHRSAVSNPHH
jgi:hypothetical protein